MFGQRHTVRRPQQVGRLAPAPKHLPAIRDAPLPLREGESVMLDDARRLDVQALETVVASTTAMPPPSSSPTASTSRRANTRVTSSSSRAERSR